MLVLLAACAGAPDPVDTGTAPPTSSTDEDPVALALDDMPRCKPGTDDGALDVDGACADSVCLGDAWPDVEAALGAPSSCLYLVDGSTCFFDDGLVISFADDDADGTPNDDATAYGMAVNPPFAGGTTDGLALDATLRCFVDVLGNPDSVSFGNYDGVWLVRTMAWDDLFFMVYDFGDDKGLGAPDGLPDFVQFTNYLFY